ncbi:MAG: prepilin-type N-terminal cleavage/methylation domain-containing protein, partial [Pseudomonadota bacterium]
MSFSNVKRQSGITLVELMVALAIGSFLIIGAVQIYNQSRQAYAVNESIARVQEITQFAMDTIEADLRMASNWGRNSRGLAVEGRSINGAVNPKGLATGLAAAGECGVGWALNLALPIDGDNNSYTLACAATGGAQAQSDVITIRRASVAPVALENGRLQIQSTRIQGELFEDGTIPVGFSPADSATHNLMVTSYY